MLVLVNGKQLRLADTASVADALTVYGAPPTGIAVALDGDVVSRSAWASTRLRDGAAIEVLTAVQGG